MSEPAAGVLRVAQLAPRLPASRRKLTDDARAKVSHVVLWHVLGVQAEGHDDQYIYVVPSLDLVVVRNGSYTKYDGPAVADSNLFSRYPSGDIVLGQGTAPPEDGWDSAAFLAPIIESIQD